MIDRTSFTTLMQSRVNSKRKRPMIRWLSSVGGSVSVTATCTLLTCAILFPKLWMSPQTSLSRLPSILPNVLSNALPNGLPSSLSNGLSSGLSNGLADDSPNSFANRFVSALPKIPLSFAPAKKEKSSPAARPILMTERRILGVPLYVTSIDLTDPKTFVSIGLANQATQANSARSTKGDEAFRAMVRRHRAAVTVSGTFFSMDSQKRVMGNMVAGGQFLKYSPWENYGTTLGIRTGNRPEMVTARVEGKPEWERHWFSLTAGPRLLKKGKIWINPQQEGFSDPAVMGVARRVAIGFPEHGKRLLLVTFRKPITLQKEASIMRSLGCHEAMNLDGGTSVALAQGSRIIQRAGRELTNVITVYDAKFPAPNHLRQSWAQFQRDEQVAMRRNGG